MVKLARGGRRQLPAGVEPKPLFPPGKLPVFGPPPANSRVLPHPRHRQGGYGGPGPGLPPRPPPPLMSRMPMPPPMPRRVGPPPLMGPHPPPLMGPHGMPPRPHMPPPPFMHRRRMPPRLGPPPVKRLNKNFRKGKKRNNKNEEEAEDDEEDEEDGHGNEDFWCETCDRRFKDYTGLEVHLGEHVVCGKDGCTYSMHFKLLKNHLKVFHNKQLSARLNQCGDINQWIQERKRNYPTKENIERKLAEKKEKEERGESLTTDDNGKKHERGRRQKQTRKKFNPKRKNNKLAKIRDQIMSMKTAGEPGSGVSLISSIPKENLEDEDENMKCDEGAWSDSEWMETGGPQENSKESELVPKNASLIALISSYDSDSATDPEVCPQTSTPASVNQENSFDIEKTQEEINDEEGAPEEAPIERNIEVNNTADEAENNSVVKNKYKRPGRERKRKNIRAQAESIPRRRLTLLEKLLQKEIVHERNQILQCIRYIIANNFFDTPRGKTNNMEICQKEE